MLPLGMNPFIEPNASGTEMKSFRLAPDTFEEMKRLTAALAAEFPFLRDIVEGDEEAVDKFLLLVSTLQKTGRFGQEWFTSPELELQEKVALSCRSLDKMLAYLHIHRLCQKLDAVRVDAISAYLNKYPELMREPAVIKDIEEAKKPVFLASQLLGALQWEALRAQIYAIKVRHHLI